MDLLFASSNINKVKEIRELMPKGYNLLSLADLNYTDELEENTETLEGNALQKARFVYQKFGLNCFADDSGLEVEALDGKPGVHSAYFAGLPRNDQGNIQMLLAMLGKEFNRKARFRTIIALIMEGREVIFEGDLKGSIAIRPVGENGFGYDPVFIPQNMELTLAQLSREGKNQISHRARAVQQLIAYISRHKT